MGTPFNQYGVAWAICMCGWVSLGCAFICKLVGYFVACYSDMGFDIVDGYFVGGPKNLVDYACDE